MCVTFISLSSRRFPKSKYKLILLNNRDEEFDRPTSKLAWEDGILAGRDEEARERGTWLGVNHTGKIGVLLCITEELANSSFPSRGPIVPDFLKCKSSPKEYCSDLAKKAENFNGFQFLALERNSEGVFELASLTNRLVPEILPVCWGPGEYGFGNSPRSHPFKKVTHGEKLFMEALESLDLETASEEAIIQELLMKVATDRTACFPDEQIKEQTGKVDGSYKHLCSLFVRNLKNTFGTRSHTVLLVDNEDKVTVFEKRMTNFPEDIEQAEWETTTEKFHLSA